jgi:hypothetical protein
MVSTTTRILHVLHVVFAWTSLNHRLYFHADNEIILFFFYIWSLISFLVFPIYSGCTARVEWLYLSGSLLVLPREWWEYFVFSTFGFYSFSCTSYIKSMYCSCRMVVLIVIKYLNFLADDGIILFFLHLDFVSFLVLSIVSCSPANVEWLYFSSSSIWTTSWITRFFFVHLYFIGLFVLPIISGYLCFM